MMQYKTDLMHDIDGATQDASSTTEEGLSSMHSDMHYLLGKALLSRADTNSRTGAASTALAPDIEQALLAFEERTKADGKKGGRKRGARKNGGVR